MSAETVEWADLTEAQKRQVIDGRLLRGIGTDRATGEAIPAVPPDPESETP